eukprot:5180855-Amphidinium_carterae.1
MARQSAPHQTPTMEFNMPDVQAFFSGNFRALTAMVGGVALPALVAAGAHKKVARFGEVVLKASDVAAADKEDTIVRSVGEDVATSCFFLACLPRLW